MDSLSELPDPRKPSNGTRHDFREILVIAICAMLSDADSFEDIGEWAHVKADWLKRFLVLNGGVPSADTFLRVFRILDPACFEAVFRRWVSSIVGALGGTVAIDGKCLRGSADADTPPAHMVSAFSTELGLVLGQERVSGKSNEISAIPALLEALYLKGLLVSIDAMGCQREIAAKIREKGADYLLAVKGNQPSLHNEVRWRMSEVSATPAHEHFERSHGRVVLQLSWATDAAGAVDPLTWADCKTVGRVVSQRIVGENASEIEERYYISSRVLTAQELAQAVRAHWGIENRLHWMLDVGFGEDASQVRKDAAPENLSLLKKIVLNLIRADTTDAAKKTSLRQKRKRAAWDDNVRMRMLGIQPL